ncbi:hypothetical protein [Paenibacillus piri]|uniref:YhfM-like domain-containing protein n=1 Tax=Paenibacillus piri TaxID=2547395 RepID=A0A4V2ZST8_9BACL|nr:hypothetical protein [Paenibacillus piri]TDF94484.1 hypothetical protein E1757_24065 [Paenibacillus piri]
MKQLLIVAFSLTALMLFVLAGCGKPESGSSHGGQSIRLEAEHVTSITVKKAGGQPAEVTDTEARSRFVQALHAAAYDRGKLDITAPDYVAVVKLDTGTELSFSFWIEKAEYTGLLQQSGRDGHFRLPDSARSDLLKLFQEAAMGN